MITYDDKLKTNGELNYKAVTMTGNAVTEFVDDDASGSLTLS